MARYNCRDGPRGRQQRSTRSGQPRSSPSALVANRCPIEAASPTARRRNEWQYRLDSVGLGCGRALCCFAAIVRVFFRSTVTTVVRRSSTQPTHQTMAGAGPSTSHTSDSGPSASAAAHPLTADSSGQEHNDSILHLEPDTATPSDSDADSAFDANSSASTSIASSILNYEYTNGRRYHGYRSGAYVLPNDDEEQDRLDLLHHIFLLMLDGKLYDAPMAHPPQRVLDIGTGTGIWVCRLFYPIL